MGLVRSAVHHYCSTGRVCAALTAGQGVWGRCRLSHSPSLLSPSSLALLAVRVAGCPVRGSPPFACWYAIPCGL